MFRSLLPIFKSCGIIEKQSFFPPSFFPSVVLCLQHHALPLFCRLYVPSFYHSMQNIPFARSTLTHFGHFAKETEIFRFFSSSRLNPLTHFEINKPVDSKKEKEAWFAPFVTVIFGVIRMYVATRTFGCYYTV